jgi:hypothetical protein
VPTELTDLEACPSGCEVVRDLSDVVELTRAMMEK